MKPGSARPGTQTQPIGGAPPQGDLSPVGLEEGSAAGSSTWCGRTTMPPYITSIRSSRTCKRATGRSSRGGPRSRPRSRLSRSAGPEPKRTPGVPRTVRKASHPRRLKAHRIGRAERRPDRRTGIARLDLPPIAAREPRATPARHCALDQRIPEDPGGNRPAIRRRRRIDQHRQWIVSGAGGARDVLRRFAFGDQTVLRRTPRRSPPAGPLPPAISPHRAVPLARPPRSPGASGTPNTSRSTRSRRAPADSGSCRPGRGQAPPFRAAGSWPLSATARPRRRVRRGRPQMR